MALAVSQEILDALTDVTMPRLAPEPEAAEHAVVGGFTIPVQRAGAVVVGSGAAGLRAAVEMKRRGVDVAILSQSAWGGTSACSGSDKQTLHTANTKDQGDNFFQMAAAIGAGGAMDEDTAYIEAVGSIRAMASLQYLGLPLPQDDLGGTLRYQTDHDEVGRATSCGPRTSRLMVKVLAEEALRLGIPFFNQTTVVKVVKAAGRVAGVLAIRAKAASAANPYGLALFPCSALVLAAGGPGELYRDSVFPNGCFGTLGLALETGLTLTNITESQFGIGTRREGFPWNLSGTYVQVIPHIYSVDADGHEHHFLADYYRTTQEMASNIFRKGYQWPFHASRMLEFQSSLVDLAIFREGQKGRRVFMDFNRNPLPIDQPFSLARLDPDVAGYLKSAGADHALPIDRLRHMNPLAIELYKRYKVDITTDPLEFAVNNQHMNGGIEVDTWGRTNLPGIYAVGEAAGTHGATRPGGSALNAGQVFGTRVAEHVAASGAPVQAPEQVLDVAEAAARPVAELAALFAPESPLAWKDIRSAVQARMSDKAGILCTPGDVADALIEARALNTDIRASGIALSRPSEAARLVQWQQMALASEAVLTALDDYIAKGGGSRGARAICDPAGESLPQSAIGPLPDYRFRAEREEDKGDQLLVQMAGTEMVISRRANRSHDGAKSFFERDWPAWLTGAIYKGGSNRT
ncbi:FAD-binding protein [Pseudoruegeria sp. SHC-113]|uniref:FAD-dependent oxidoreductase n=1 Tax=Pseudoruegeria sp. SHC-113 TaxID=2855439 RepID=UPI0021BA6424|nr:FAD-binding protein [Pseudoruegeria sp. SHC-113]MCT8162208.1 FAD-binding protein [Pseudoruegeria sp. SHC-113]